MKRGLILTVGVILLIAGFSTSGLWPWQLPAVFFGAVLFGGFLATYALSNWKK